MPKPASGPKDQHSSSSFINALYSASLLETQNMNLGASSCYFPFGVSMIRSALLPSLVDEPSMYKLQTPRKGLGGLVGLLLCAKKSARAWALMACLASNSMPYLGNSIAHLSNHLEVSSFWSMFLSGWSVRTVTLCASK